MAVIYRTDDGTRWGTGKGSNLTPTEVDLNFWQLLQLIQGVVDDPPTPNEITSITATGLTITFHFFDGTELTVPAPVLQFRWRGEWAAAQVYEVMDMVKVEGLGIFTVMVDHTSDASFDPDREISAEPVYNQLIGVASVVGGDPADHDFLTYDITSGTWTNRTPAVATSYLPAFIGDSGAGGTKGLVPAPATGDAADKFLKADGTWELPATGASALVDLTDVDVPTPADGDVLTFDDALDKWIAVAPAPPGSPDLDSIGSTPGQILYRDTSAWAARNPGGDGMVLEMARGGRPGWIATPRSMTIKQAVSLATTEPLAFTPAYDNGTSGAGATLTASSNGVLTVDGLAIELDTELLVKDQADAAENGIYKCSVEGDGSTPYELTRRTDCDIAGVVVAGIFCLVIGGSANGHKQYVLDSVQLPVIGTDDLPWIELTAPPRGFTAMGAWDGDAEYSQFDVVTYSGAAWLCYQDVAAPAAAGPPTWDPANKSADITLSNGDLTATSTTNADKGVIATQPGQSSGKWYFEVQWTTINNNNSGAGLALAAIDLTCNTVHEYLDGTAIGNIWNGDSNSGYTFQGFATGFRGAIAVDLDAHKVWMTKDATTPAWNQGTSGTQDPATGDGGIPIHASLQGVELMPLLSMRSSSEVAILVCAPADFTGTPPSGFDPWVSGAGGPPNDAPDTDIDHWLGG